MNNNSAYFIALIIALVFSIRIAAQTSENTAAKIGKDIISTDEFLHHYELMPHLSSGESNPDSVKLNFLYTLIAEKLRALEAQSLGFENQDIIKYSLNSLEKLFVRDALYNLEVTSKFIISEQDLNDGIQKSITTLNANVISAYDSSAIFMLFNSFTTPSMFDSAFSKPDSNYQHNNVDIYFGDLKDESIENKLYTLNPQEISPPFHYQDGWFIFKLIEKIPQALAEQQLKDLPKSIKRIINERRSMNTGNLYLQQLLGGVKVSADEQLGKALAEKIIYKFSSNAKIKEANDSSLVYLSQTDFYQMMDEFGEDTLAMDFILFDENPISLKEFLYDLMQNSFSVKSTERNNFLSRLSSTIKYLIRQNLIAREGYRQGLQNLPEVREDLNIWKVNYLAQILRNRFLDSTDVSEDEVYQFYLKRNGEESNLQVNIIEILCKDLKTIETVLNEMQNGKHFEELAPKYNERESTQSSKGEFGWFPVSMYGDIGKNAATMEVEEIFGPIFTPEGYSIFKLIGKKQAELPSSETFEQLKSQLALDAKANKLSEKFDSYTSSLAKKYGVTVYTSAIKSLDTTQINMFTYRYIGFGGMITAFPFTSPWYNWSKKSENNIEVLP